MRNIKQIKFISGHVERGKVFFTLKSIICAHAMPRNISPGKMLSEVNPVTFYRKQ